MLVECLVLMVGSWSCWGFSDEGRSVWLEGREGMQPILLAVSLRENREAVV